MKKNITFDLVVKALLEADCEDPSRLAFRDVVLLGAGRVAVSKKHLRLQLDGLEPILETYEGVAVGRFTEISLEFRHLVNMGTGLDGTLFLEASALNEFKTARKVADFEGWILPEVHGFSLKGAFVEALLHLEGHLDVEHKTALAKDMGTSEASSILVEAGRMLIRAGQKINP